MLNLVQFSSVRPSSIQPITVQFSSAQFSSAHFTHFISVRFIPKSSPVLFFQFSGVQCRGVPFKSSYIRSGQVGPAQFNLVQSSPVRRCFSPFHFVQLERELQLQFSSTQSGSVQPASVRSCQVRSAQFSSAHCNIVVSRPVQFR